MTGPTGSAYRASHAEPSAGPPSVAANGAAAAGCHSGPRSDAATGASAPGPQARMGVPELGIATRRDRDGTVYLAVTGEIDRDSAGQLTAAIGSTLAADHPDQLIVDLDAVTFVDSSGLRTLLTGQRVAGERGAALRIENAHGVVLRVLSVTGLLDLLDGHQPYR